MEMLDNWVQIKKTIILPKNSSQLTWRVRGDNLFFDHTLITVNKNIFWNQLSEDYMIYNHYIARAKEQNIDTEN
jgi:hypothetical protein